MTRLRKTVIIVQARMGSSRLPGKVMRPLAGRPLLENIIDRLAYTREADEIIIATTDKQQDGIISDTAGKLNIPCFRGSENDVLGRYYHAAVSHKADTVVRVCADNPLTDPRLIDEMLIKFHDPKSDFDYLSNNLKRTFPLGLDAEIFSFSALEKAYNEARLEYEREHVTPYIKEHPELFKLYNYTCHADLSCYRLTVDTQEDFELAAGIYRALYRKDKIFLLDDILDYLRDYPELTEINKHIKQKPANPLSDKL